jgi:CBS domain-containing protein
MALHNIGALLVLKEQKLVGIFFARDYARSVQAKLKKLTNLKDQH